MSVEIYTKTGCPNCAAAVRSFKLFNIPVKEINLSDHPERIEELVKLSGGRKLPVIVNDEKVSVGYNGAECEI
ncbi:MAG: Uxx-star family glutaredoxin-like (seleno)protein [Roseiarcus sp.]